MKIKNRFYFMPLTPNSKMWITKEGVIEFKDEENAQKMMRLLVRMNKDEK